MKERKMVKVVYINDADGYTNDVVGRNTKGRIIEVDVDFAKKLVKDGRSNFFAYAEDKKEEKPLDKKPKSKDRSG